jgi:hypothetical protein
MDDLADRQQLAQAGHQRPVDAARPTAAAEHQQGFFLGVEAQRLAGLCFAQLEQLAADRIAGDSHFLAPEKVVRFLAGHGDALGKAAQKADSLAGHHVGQVDEHRHPLRPGGQRYGHAGITTCDQDRVGLKAGQDTPRLADAASNLRGVADLGQQAHPAQPAGGQPDEGEPLALDQLLLDPTPAADPQHVGRIQGRQAAAGQPGARKGFEDGQGRVDVPAGPAARDH